MSAPVRQSRRLAGETPEFDGLPDTRKPRSKPAPKTVIDESLVEEAIVSPDRLKRDAEGTPEMSPDGDVRSPKKKPAYETGFSVPGDSSSPQESVPPVPESADLKTKRNLADSFKAEESTSLVQEVSGCLSVPIPAWEDPEQPPAPEVAVIRMTAEGLRSMAKFGAALVEEVSRKHAEQAEKFLQGVMRDRQLVEGEQELKLAAMSEKLLENAREKERERQEGFFLILNELQRRYDGELAAAKEYLESLGTQQLQQEEEKLKLELTHRYQEAWDEQARLLNEGLDSRAMKERAALEREFRRKLAEAHGQFQDELQRTRKEAGEELASQAIEANSRVLALEGEVQALKRSQLNDLLSLQAHHRDDVDRQNEVHVKQATLVQKELYELREAMRTKTVEVERAQAAVMELKAAAATSSFCAVCPGRELEKERLLTQLVAQQEREKVLTIHLGEAREELQTLKKTLETQASEAAGLCQRYEAELRDLREVRQGLERTLELRFEAAESVRDSVELASIQNAQDKLEARSAELEQARAANVALLDKIKADNDALRVEWERLQEAESRHRVEVSLHEVRVAREKNEVERDRLALESEKRGVYQLQESLQRAPPPVPVPEAPYPSAKSGSFEQHGYGSVPLPGDVSVHMAIPAALNAYPASSAASREYEVRGMQQTEIQTDTAALRMPTSYTLSQTPFVPSSAPGYNRYGSQSSERRDHPVPRSAPEGNGYGRDTGESGFRRPSENSGPPELPNPDQYGNRRPGGGGGGGEGPGDGGGGGGGGAPPPHDPYRWTGPANQGMADRRSMADARKFAPKLDGVDRPVPLEHFLTRFQNLGIEYSLSEDQLIRIFDERLMSSGILAVVEWWARRSRDHSRQSWPEVREAFRSEFITKTLSAKVYELTEHSRRTRHETVREYAWRIADAARDAGLPADRAVVMMINGCEDVLVSSCLRTAPSRPTTIETSLSYLRDLDIDLDRRLDGTRSSSRPAQTEALPSTPARSPRAGARGSPASSDLRDLHDSITQMRREMKELKSQTETDKAGHFAAVHDYVVAAVGSSSPSLSDAGEGNTPVAPRIRGNPDMKTDTGEPVCGRCLLFGHPRNKCPRANMTCARCRTGGHHPAECSLPRSDAGGGRNPGYAKGQWGGSCYTCKQPGHQFRNCPMNNTPRASPDASVSGDASPGTQ